MDHRRPIIADILEMLHKNGVTSLDSTQMFERVQHTIEISERIVQTGLVDLTIARASTPSLL
jgi:hypothetical protein